MHSCVCMLTLEAELSALPWLLKQPRRLRGGGEGGAARGVARRAPRGRRRRRSWGPPKGASWAALRISVPAGGKSESLQPPRLNPGSDGLRGCLDSRPVSSPQVGPGAVRPARACTGSSCSSAGRRPGPLSRDPRREKGSPRTRTGSPSGTPPQPRARVPRCCDPSARPTGTPTHTVPAPGPAYRSGEAAAAARSPGPRRLPAAGSEVASSPRPRRQRWSLVPAASAQDTRARLLCKEENATEGFKVKKERARGGTTPPRPAPPLFFLPRPAPPAGVQAAARGAQCAAGSEAGARGGWCVTCPAVVPQLMQPPPPSSACAIAPPGGHRGAPGGAEAVVPPEASLGNAGQPPLGKRPWLQHPEGCSGAGPAWARGKRERAGVY
ncbi:unnamed protein product [Rangifer tarandus platyrhynchus]|uniref:Uncharacterized protein n=2 Tax=Rangifer tarandus platyrhynchus TaxID=3082113 RepID=A0ACB0FMM1_RANTA|nr:unnamed protein product [Rangifer tarandus platyrhynchus]CAI9713962.1 unnamed protein product [Rangifer tarandus platyrhynchus]